MAEDLRTPQEWAYEDGYVIMDPDGWRPPHNDIPFDQPITRKEYSWRMCISTVRRLPDDAS